jgi:hypothetical protein
MTGKRIRESWYEKEDQHRSDCHIDFQPRTTRMGRVTEARGRQSSFGRKGLVFDRDMIRFLIVENYQLNNFKLFYKCWVWLYA